MQSAEELALVAAALQAALVLAQRDARPMPASSAAADGRIRGSRGLEDARPGTEGLR